MIDLMDAEVIEAGKLIQYLTDKYSQRSDSKRNIESFQKEAKEKFAEIGLDVKVNVLVVGKPEIEIVGRLVDFDVERQARDVKKGLADEFWTPSKGK